MSDLKSKSGAQAVKKNEKIDHVTVDFDDTFSVNALLSQYDRLESELGQTLRRLQKRRQGTV